MSGIRAVVVDPSLPERLVIRDVGYPAALSSEALVSVHAISLNRGEVHTALLAEEDWRPGCDLARIVEKGHPMVLGHVLFQEWLECFPLAHGRRW